MLKKAKKSDKYAKNAKKNAEYIYHSKLYLWPWSIIIWLSMKY